VRGRIGDAGYAERWAQAHQDVADPVAYRGGYADLLMLNALMPEGYSLLDVGCGTAGYHHLLGRAGEVIGIDPIPEMIAAAERFRAKHRIDRAIYACSTFEDFEPHRGLDAIRLTGVYGWYMPWRGKAAVLEKTFRLLNPSGIALLSYVAPATPLQAAKAILAPARTVVTFRRQILGMVRSAGLAAMLEVRTSSSAVLFARKPGESPAKDRP
jgi:SAM-dependent methyltransferase